MDTTTTNSLPNIVIFIKYRQFFRLEMIIKLALLEVQYKMWKLEAASSLLFRLLRHILLHSPRFYETFFHARTIRLYFETMVKSPNTVFLDVHYNDLPLLVWFWLHYDELQGFRLKLVARYCYAHTSTHFYQQQVKITEIDMFLMFICS